MGLCDEAEANVGDLGGEGVEAGIGKQSGGGGGERDGLAGAGSGVAQKNRTGEIGGLDEVGVDDGDCADAEQAEGLDDLVAERAGADDEGMQRADARGSKEGLLKA